MGEIDGGRFLRAQTAALHVADHADDFAHRRDVFYRNAGADAFSDRVFVREVAARQRLIDDDDARRLQVVALGEFAPADEPDAHRAEITVGREAQVGPRPFRSLNRTPFDLESGIGVTAAERQREDHPGGAHAGQPLDALDQLTVEAGDLLRLSVTVVWQVNSQRQNLVWVEARVDALQPQEAI